MGRGVITLSDATAVAYQSFGPDEDYYRGVFSDMYWLDPEDFDTWMYDQWEFDSEHEWDALKDWVREYAIERWPSFEAVEDEWIGDETRILARNAHSAVVISEYSGVVAISLVPDYDRREFWRDDNALGEQWRKNISAEFLTLFSEYEKIGTASNGEQFFQKVEA